MCEAKDLVDTIKRELDTRPRLLIRGKVPEVVPVVAEYIGGDTKRVRISSGDVFTVRRDSRNRYDWVTV